MNRTRSEDSCVRMRCDLDHQYRNSLWCLFPRVQCECGYKKLIDGSHESIESLDQNARIPFFMTDSKWVSVDVECQVPARTLCIILAKKNDIPEDPKWCIVEYFRAKNLRRVLEDNDDVLRCHEEFLDFSNGKGKMFFEYMDNKEIMYTPELIDRPYTWFEEKSFRSEYFSRTNKFCFVVQGDETITMVTDCWYKIPHKNIWNKSYLLLQNGFVKLINREVAINIIKKNKPEVDEDEEIKILEAQETEQNLDKKNRRSSVYCPYQYIISKSRPPPVQPKSLVKNPKGFDAKELKVYTRFEDPHETNPPTDHIIVLIERINESEASSIAIPSDESANNTESDDNLTVKGLRISSKPGILNWPSNIKAKLGRKKKDKEEVLKLNHENTSSDEDVGCNAIRLKKGSKEKYQKNGKSKKSNEKNENENGENLEYYGAEEYLYIEEFTDNAGFKYKTMNIAFDTNDLMRIWMDVLRYTKNGDYIRINSNSFIERQKMMEAKNMDFTGHEGKIIDENEPTPSTSQETPPPEAPENPLVDDQKWFEEFIREPIESYERQLIPCKRQNLLPATVDDIQNIIDEEETYANIPSRPPNIPSRPRGILKNGKDNGQKKKVDFKL